MIYEKGFTYYFDENACEKCGGKCCTGESGYIFLSLDEMRALASFFSLSLDEFKDKYCIKVGLRYSLKEKSYERGLACIFFDSVSKKCSVYEYRPKQCRTFPFWDYFKTHKKELEKECIGVHF